MFPYFRHGGNKETGKEMKYLSKSPRETARLAKLLAEEILKTKSGKKALVIGLIGELGAGKTTFIKFFLRALGVKSRITSPTFIFSRRYQKNIWHFDVYRLSSPAGARAIGLTEAMIYPTNLVVIEWADRVKGILPRGTIWVELRHSQKPNERHLTFNRR